MRHYRNLFLFCLIMLPGILSAKEASTNATRYIALEPPLVINVDDNGSIRFLQVAAQVSVKTPDADGLLEHHDPAIRDALIMLLSGKQVSEIRTVKGKERLRKQARSEIRKIMKKQTGESVIDAVYFTSFIIQ